MGKSHLLKQWRISLEKDYAIQAASNFALFNAEDGMSAKFIGTFIRSNMMIGSGTIDALLNKINITKLSQIW